MRSFPLTTLIGLMFLTPLIGCPPVDDKAEDTGMEDTGDTDTGTRPTIVHTDPSAALSVDDGDMAVAYGIHVTGTAELTAAGGVETAAEAEAAWTALNGSLTYTSDIEGVADCDLDVDIVGTPYTGACEGCDFAFEIEGTTTRDDSGADCAPNARLSFVPDDIWGDFVFAHADPYVVEGDYETYSWNDALISGGSYYYAYTGTTYPGPYMRLVSYEASPYGTFSQTDNQIEWTFDYAGSYGDLSEFSEYCGYFYTYYNYGSIVGSGGTSAVDCEGTVTDVWTFEVVEGGTAAVSVDTVAADSAFDAAFYVNGPDGCQIGFADDTFDCTYTPADYQCPSAIFEDLAAGTYEVVVLSYGSCTGETAGYEFQVDVTSPA